MEQGDNKVKMGNIIRCNECRQYAEKPGLYKINLNQQINAPHEFCFIHLPNCRERTEAYDKRIKNLQHKYGVTSLVTSNSERISIPARKLFRERSPTIMNGYELEELLAFYAFQHRIDEVNYFMLWPKLSEHLTLDDLKNKRITRESEIMLEKWGRIKKDFPLDYCTTTPMNRLIAIDYDCNKTGQRAREKISPKNCSLALGKFACNIKREGNILIKADERLNEIFLEQSKAA